MLPTRLRGQRLESTIGALTLCVLVIAAGSQARSAPVEYQNVAIISGSLQKLQRFEVSHSLTDLSSAVDMMAPAFPGYWFTQGDLIARRRLLVQSYAPILKAIEVTYDPTFDPHDPKNLPYINGPPIINDQPFYRPSCDTPLELQTKVCEVYTAAVRENETKRKRFAHWRKILDIDESAMAGLEVTLAFIRKIAPPGMPSDAATLDGILRKAGLSDTRRREIAAFF